MATIKDLAGHVGMSVSTVSKAMNGYSDISSATRELVRKAAHEIGYKPNMSARALKTRRTYNLGVLFADEGNSGLRHPYYSRVLDGFRVTAEGLGFDVTFISHNIGGAEMTYLEHCRLRGVDGVCIACVDFHAAEISELVADVLPVVAIDHAHSGVSNVLSANRQGVSDLVAYILSHGHRNIAFIHGQFNPITYERLAGLQNTMLARGVPLRPELLLQAEYQQAELTRERTRQLLQMENRPTCIIFPDVNCAHGGIKVLREAGLRVPEDISAATFDSMDFSPDLSPQLTTVLQNAEEIGTAAATMLVDRIERPFETLLADKIIPCTLFKGETVAQLNI